MVEIGLGSVKRYCSDDAVDAALDRQAPCRRGGLGSRQTHEVGDGRPASSQ